MAKLEKKTLDELGKAVVRAGALSAREVDRIAAKPELFDAIRARVNSVTDKPASRHILSTKLVGALSSIALVGAVALAFVVFRTKPVDVVHGPPSSVPLTRDATKFADPDKVVSAELPRSTASQPKVERISAKPEIKFNRPKQSAAQQIRYEGDFYALSYAGDPNETDRGGRIVRVDVPRSTLFAMGIDVPLENETETVKADLLIGSDGVTRAIRVVK
jgi:hypothetical protein